MNAKTNCLTLLSLSLVATLLIMGCDGGKKRTDCSTTNCSTTKPVDNKCPIHQKMKDKVCTDICSSAQHWDNGACKDNEINIEIISKSACSAENGYTQVIMQFIARNSQGYAIDPELNSQNIPTGLTSEILIDGKPINVESTINHESLLLKSDMVLTLVLDNSGSMLEHNPPAFEPMKAAAISILKQTKSTWENNKSKFDWQILWFNDYLYKPALNTAQEAWTIDDIDKIPAPKGGTELYKAINHMVGIHKNLYSKGLAAKPRDQHVMIVLSDGEDTHSHIDNKNFAEQENLNDILFWSKFGAPAADIESIKSTIANDGPPNLRVHVIGLGTAADDIKDKLVSIAQAGHGLYFYESTSGAIQTVFENVQKEFITMQTIGIKTSPVNGTYQFSIKAKHTLSQAEGRSKETFTVDVGPSLPKCLTE